MHKLGEIVQGALGFCDLHIESDVMFLYFKVMLLLKMTKLNKKLYDVFKQDCKTATIYKI